MAGVRVEFIDAATGAAIGKTELDPEQLPETFAIATKLTIAGKEWSVERAEPATRAEFAASGTLRLTLRAIVLVDPKTILFSLPTIESALPAMRDGDPTHAHVLAEDDWRQRELVARRFEPEISVERDAIRAVRAERKGAGFTRIHVRARIPEPLAGLDLPYARVVAAIGDAARRELAFASTAGLVEGGFAFRLPTTTVYGYEIDGRVAVLGFTAAPDATLRAAFGSDVLVVDWLA